MKRRFFVFSILLLSLCLGLLPLTAGAAPRSYELWVGGVQVTDENLVIDSADLPGVSGSASYDPASHTLTLRDFVFSGRGAEGSLLSDAVPGRAALLIGGDWTFLEVQGACSLTEAGGSGAASRGICAAGTENLILTGDGVLTVRAGEDPVSQGVYVRRSIHLVTGKLEALGGDGAASCGVFSQGVRVYPTARLTAVGGSYGVWSAPEDSDEVDWSIWEGTAYEDYCWLMTGIGAYGDMTASGEVSALRLEQREDGGSAWFSVGDDCHATAHTEPGEAGAVTLRVHKQSYGDAELEHFKTVSVQSSGLEGINLTCAGAAFANGSWGNSFQSLSGEYMVKPDARMWQYIGSSSPLFYEDQRYIMSHPDDIPLTFYLSPTDRPDTLHQLVLYGSKPLDPALLSLHGVEQVEPFTAGFYGDEEEAMGPYGPETGRILYYYSCMLRIPQKSASLGIYYDGTEIRTIPLLRDADGTHENVARRVTTFWVSDYRDDEDGKLVSVDVTMSGFGLPTDPGQYMFFDRVWSEALEDYEFLPVARCTALTVDEAGRYTLSLQVFPAYRSAEAWVRADGACLLVERNSEWDTGETTYDGKIFTALGYYEYAVDGYTWVDLRTPFDCLYKEHPVRATADGKVVISLEADAGDVGDTVFLAVYDQNGRLLGLKQETVTAPGSVELSAPAEGGYKASAFQLDPRLEPKEEKATCFLETAAAEE